MRPKETLYRISEPRDIPVLKKMWAENRKMFGKPKPLGWPTVVAERNSKILGFLSTWAGKKALVAGPCVLNGGSSGFTILRLIEAYENLLRFAGVKFYYFAIDKKNKKWLDMVKRVGLEPYDEDDKESWFKRTL